jgi:3-phenylpropionate/trans-cinnamate dioxygenase ferredoxin reductase component
VSLVVVGASLAGLSAARSARMSGYTEKIVVVGDEKHAPYDRPPLSKDVLLAEADPSFRALFKPADLDSLRIDLRLGRPAVGVDLARRVLTLAGDTKLGYQHLILATGAAPTRVPLPGHLPAVYLRTWDDALAIRRALKAARRLVIVGGGLIGSEVASAARSIGVDVTIVDLNDMPLRKTFGEQVAARVRQWHTEHGVRCIDRTTIDPGATPSGAVRLSDGVKVEADLILCAVGVRPNTSWLDGSGLDIEDGVLCDRTCTTSDVAVLAAGDVARMRLASDDLAPSARLEHRDSARQQGVVAGQNAWRPPPERTAITTVPYAWSDLYGHKIQTVGWPTMATSSRVESITENSGQLRVSYHQNGRLIGGVVIDRPQDLAALRAAIGAEIGWSAPRAQAAAGGFNAAG